ncbi:MAG TPA: TonB-dependent receptor [Candidatus Binatia bacterium]|nr:TonB-dependent receptor [Candidatus Binatia bacterium]
MTSERPTTRQKALHLNLDDRKYGVIAEIGAGQEVARWFFVAGRAAGTVAKTISAYDMEVSDGIYGRAHRYVSRERLESMLRHEFEQLVGRLDAKRGEQTSFFAFADTVATRRADRPGPGEGWMGIRFQHAPRAEPSEILVHVSMLDRVRVHEQETLGVAGINLIYGAFYLHDDPPTLIASLLDMLGRERIEVDVIKFCGPAFEGVDNRLMSLQLVEQGLCDAAMFLANGEVVQPSEVLYKRPVLVERGAFRPVTNLTLDMLEGARQQFVAEPGVAGQDPVILLEMTLRDLTEGTSIAHTDFLARVDLLRALGHGALVSRFARYFGLVEFLYRYTDKPIGLAVGVPGVRAIVDEAFYEDLPGRLIESCGRLFKHNVKMYVYPWRDPESGRVVTIDDVPVPDSIRPLLAFLRGHGYVEPIGCWQDSCLDVDAAQVLARIQRGDPSWEDMVPPAVARAIREERLFGCVPPPGGSAVAAGAQASARAPSPRSA